MSREEVRPGVHRRLGVPSNLPAELSSFVGRESHVLRGTQLLTGPRVLTLTGPGGCGKTRLARRIAGTCGDSAPDGIWWVELAGENAVAGAVTRAMGFSTPTHHLVPYLDEASALVVLDNCEHLLPEVAAVVETLLRAAPDVRVLATSREALGVEGERVWRVPPLEVPPLTAPADEVAGYEAVRLFAERASAVGGEIDAMTSVVAALCRALDGMPLAVELAAARSASMTLEAILEGVHDRFRLLTGGPRTAPDRLRSMRASLAWSHDLCDEREQVLLRRLALFDGGFDASAAVAVAGTAPLAPSAVADTLAMLVAKSLVQVVGPRYRLLESVRAYARERLEDSGEALAVADRHLVWAADLVEHLEPATARCDIEVLDRLEGEMPNVRVALSYATGRPPGTIGEHHGLRLVAGLAFFHARRGYGIAGIDLGENVIAADTAAPGDLRARALWAVAYARFYGGEFAVAGETAAHALAESEAADDRSLTARCRVLIGALTLFTDPAAARDICQEVLAAEEADDSWCATEALGFIIFSHELQHRPAEALPYRERIRQLALAADDRHNLVWVDLSAGMAGQMAGEFAAARDAYRSAGRAGAAIGDPLLVLYAYAGLVSVALRAGRHDELPTLAAAMNRPEMRFAQLTLEFAASLQEMARLADDADAPAGAVITAGTVIAPYVPVEAPSIVLAGARRMLARGEVETARAAVEATRGACAAGGSAMTGPCQVVLARIHRRHGDAGRAAQLAHDGLADIVDAHLWADLPDALAVLGGLAVDHDRPADGVRLLAAADALGTAMGCHDVLHTDTGLDTRRAQDALGDGFADVWAQGHALDRAAAVTYARRARGPRRRPSSGWESLSPAELQVVRLAAAGHANPAIARRLFITRGTVKTHLTHVFAKLGVTSRTQLAAEAVRHGVG